MYIFHFYCSPFPWSCVLVGRSLCDVAHNNWVTDDLHRDPISTISASPSSLRFGSALEFRVCLGFHLLLFGSKEIHRKIILQQKLWIEIRVLLFSWRFLNWVFSSNHSGQPLLLSSFCLLGLDERNCFA